MKKKLVSALLLGLGIFVLVLVPQTSKVWGALALDGTANSAACSTPTGSCPISNTFSTTHTYDVVILFVWVNVTGTTFSSVTGASLTWTQRTIKDTGSSVCGSASGAGVIAEYYALTTTPLSNPSITVTSSAAQKQTFGDQIFAISGANAVTPFETGATFPNKGAGGSGIPTTSATTSDTNDILVAGTTSSGSQTAGAGFAGLALSTNLNSCASGTTVVGAEYETVSALQSSVSVGFGTSSTNWAIITDAVMAPASISSVNPSAVAPYQSLSVTGSNFRGTTSISIQPVGGGASTQIADYAILSDTTITLIVPAVASGTYDVIVTNGQASSSGTSDQFTLSGGSGIGGGSPTSSCHDPLGCVDGVGYSWLALIVTVVAVVAIVMVWKRKR